MAVATSTGEIDALRAAPSPNLQWVQVRGLLGDPHVWQSFARSPDGVPLDVFVPIAGFSDLYRLVDVRNARDIRVTIPVRSGFTKALRLAASLGFHVRLLPGQPTGETLAELEEAAKFYLHDPMVEAPIEYFHSALIHTREPTGDSLWLALEEDPAIFRYATGDGAFALPRSPDTLPDGNAAERFVEDRLEDLVQAGAECAECPWQAFCRGYFKWPEPTYDCAGVKRIFAMFDEAAEAMGGEPGTREDRSA